MSPSGWRSARSPSPSSASPRCRTAASSRCRAGSPSRSSSAWSRARSSRAKTSGSCSKELAMKTSRREFLGLTAAAASAGLRFDVAPAQAQGEPVKLGVVAIRAGIAAPVGTAGLRATEWWAERVNKAGGILGRPVQLVVEEESNPKDTVERYRKLVLQDKVEAVIGGISTGVDLAPRTLSEEPAPPWRPLGETQHNGVEETRRH